MEKCLTQAERQEKKTAIKYLRGELKEHLDYLNGEPDNLCKAYQTIIESMQRQIGAKDVVEETHSVLRTEQIGFKAMLRIFNFFSELTPDERSVVIEASENGEFDGEFDGKIIPVSGDSEHSVGDCCRRDVVSIAYRNSFKRVYDVELCFTDCPDGEVWSERPGLGNGFCEVDSFAYQGFRNFYIDTVVGHCKR